MKKLRDFHTIGIKISAYGISELLVETLLPYEGLWLYTTMGHRRDLNG